MYRPNGPSDLGLSVGRAQKRRTWKCGTRRCSTSWKDKLCLWDDSAACLIMELSWNCVQSRGYVDHCQEVNNSVVVSLPYFVILDIKHSLQRWEPQSSDEWLMIMVSVVSITHTNAMTCASCGKTSRMLRVASRTCHDACLLEWSWRWCMSSVDRCWVETISRGFHRLYNRHIPRHASLYN